jgi:hypothetical protein
VVKTVPSLGLVGGATLAPHQDNKGHKVTEGAAESNLKKIVFSFVLFSIFKFCIYESGRFGAMFLWFFPAVWNKNSCPQWRTGNLGMWAAHTIPELPRSK